MIKLLPFVATILISLVFPPQTFSTAPFLIPHPKVTSVSPTTAKPGDVVSLSGEEFAYDGTQSCPYVEEQGPICHWKSVIAAYKIGRTHVGEKPDFILTINSLTLNLLQAQIPNPLPSGNGQYNLGYFLQYDPNEVGQDQASQLNWLARWDQITIVGAQNGAISQKTPKSKPLPKLNPIAINKTPTPTIVPIVQSNTLENIFSRTFLLLGSLIKGIFSAQK